MIEFYTASKRLAEEFPPIPAAQLQAHMLGRVPTSTAEYTTIKNCPGIIKYISLGYILRLHSSVTVTHKPDGTLQLTLEPEYQFDLLTGNPSTSYFEAPKFGDIYRRDLLYPEIYKIDMPWGIIVPPGYQILVLPVYYLDNPPFEIIPGILDAEVIPKVNAQMRFYRFQGQKLLPKGYPMMRLVPYKPEEHKISVRVATAQDLFEVNVPVKGYEKGLPYKKLYRKLQDIKSGH